jgi:hypothetical protein
VAANEARRRAGGLAPPAASPTESPTAAHSQR